MTTAATNIDDSTVASASELGQARIAWAGRSMPVLNAVASRIADEGHLAGKKIAVSLVLEPKTANLAQALRRAGVEVLVHAWSHSADMEVVAALRDQGFAVFADKGAAPEADLNLARAVLAEVPDIIIDDGAELIRLAHREFPDLVAEMIGAAEETTSGVRPLQMMHHDGALRIPVIAVNDSRVKYLFDNVYGTGQSCVMAFLDLTNLQIAGRTVVVVGYGWVGIGVAKYAAALGAKVVVSEIDPVKALQALHDGYEVASLTSSAHRAEVVFACTGIAGVVTAEHVEQLPDGAILATAGGGSFELPMEYLAELATRREVRAAIAEYTTDSGTRIMVVSEGECVNCADAEGNPIEVMDLSLSLQALAVNELAAKARGWTPGLYPISTQLENEVARIRLDNEGATLEVVTDALRQAMRSW